MGTSPVVIFPSTRPSGDGSGQLFEARLQSIRGPKSSRPSHSRGTIGRAGSVPPNRRLHAVPRVLQHEWARSRTKSPEERHSKMTRRSRANQAFRHRDRRVNGPSIDRDPVPTWRPAPGQVCPPCLPHVGLAALGTDRSWPHPGPASPQPGRAQDRRHPAHPKRMAFRLTTFSGRRAPSLPRGAHRLASS